jgi:hypothetical protein
MPIPKPTKSKLKPMLIPSQGCNWGPRLARRVSIMDESDWWGKPRWRYGQGKSLAWEDAMIPVRDTVSAQSLAELKDFDGFINFFRFGWNWLAYRGLELQPQRHVNHLNNRPGLTIGKRLRLSLQTVSKGFSLFRVWEGDQEELEWELSSTVWKSSIATSLQGLRIRV